MADIEISNNLEIKFIIGYAPAFQVFRKIPEDYDYVYRRLEENIEKSMKDNHKIF